MKSIKIEETLLGFKIVEELEEKSPSGYPVFITLVKEMATQVLEEVGRYFQKELALELKKEIDKKGE